MIDTRVTSVSLAALTLLLAAPARAQSTSIVSVDPGGAVGNAASSFGAAARAITPDGRFVVFHSDASNLVAGDLGGFQDVFVRDLISGATQRVSVASNGDNSNGASSRGSISDDGRYVAFESFAQNFAAGDANFTRDVFVHDRVLGITTIASVSSGGVIGNAESYNAAISGNGAFVAFASAATNLSPNDTNAHVDIYVRDLVLSRTRLVTLVPGGANGPSDFPSISFDGSFVAFESDASNLVAGDLLGATDVFLRDMGGSSFEVLSVSTAGAFGDGASRMPSLSADGSRVAFTSASTNFGTFAAPVSSFLRDRTAGTTTLINQIGGAPSNASADGVTLSKNGEYAAFLSAASNLTSGHSGSVRDAFVVRLSTGQVQRASVPTGTLPAEPSAPVLGAAGVSDDGRFALFSSAASNLAAGDSGSNEDVFVRDQQRDWYIDMDADLYGDEASIVLASFQPNGYMGIGGDCNDNDPNVNPGVAEICNGIDDNCDGDIDEIAWQRYCLPSTSQNFCVPTMNATGFPSASASSGFTLSFEGVDGGRPVSMIYGLNTSAVAWAFGSTSIRCVAFPWSRLTTFGGGGTAGACDGGYSIDWLAFMAAHPGAQGQPIGAGQTFYAQGWYRDPGAPKNSNLTDAISFTLCP